MSLSFEEAALHLEEYHLPPLQSYEDKERYKTKLHTLEGAQLGSLAHTLPATSVTLNHHA